jgi:CBS domain-containing protein
MSDHLEEGGAMSDTPLRQLLRKKGTSVITTDPGSTVYDAIATMVNHNVGSIVVTDDGELVGIFTERDYLRRIVLRGRTSKTTAVREVMTADLITVEPDTTVEAALSIMTEARCRHLPVMIDGRLAGVVSIGDCVKHLLRNAEAEIDTLERFVTGKYPG